MYVCTGTPAPGRGRIPLCLPGVGSRTAVQGELVKLSADALGWKKSTTYTVLKKLCQRGVLQNQGGTVTSLVAKQAVQCAESAAVVDKTFGGSLPRFVAAFLSAKPISDAEAAEIRALLDAAHDKEV